MNMLKAIADSDLLDMAVAGFAALAVAFVAWAMPDYLFSDIVAASGLPSVLPAAASPLGLTARLAVAGAAAGAVFVTLFLVLRALGYSRSKPTPRPVAAAPSPAPRVRRADSHPDAPPRPPISANLEFGAPLADAEPAFPEELVLERRTVPVRRVLPDRRKSAAPAAASVAEPVPAPPQPFPRAQGVRESVPDLMRRLEHGLHRKGLAMAGESAAAAPQALDERLRSAIAELQNLAPRS